MISELTDDYKATEQTQDVKIFNTSVPAEFYFLPEKLCTEMALNIYLHLYHHRWMN